MSPISNVLVANRGEIALRIIRGIHDQGLKSVAVHADQDRDSSFVAAADQAFSLNGSTAAETYMDGDKLLKIAAESGADAIHPGYGFLAESAEFAQMVADAGLSWIGPSAQSIAALGDKVKARGVAKRVGVAPVPGTDEPLTGRPEVEAFIAEYDYPVVLKRADGGGGRGISVIASQTDLDNFFSGRSDDSLGAFFIEKFVQRGRHVETQCGRDSHGNFTVYSTRDCSVQRRHQKLIEEAPAPFLPEGVETELISASQRLFEGVDYVGLGTCEFLLDEDGSVYFLEVNPRLQVEHTVTEEVSGVDLVGQQLRIGAGKPLTTGTAVRGHSIELRITSEDPAQDLAPATGTLRSIKWPTGPGIRIDTGIEEGDQVAADFDSMVAKLIVTGESRDHALLRAKRALAETSIAGLGTPVPLYQAILETQEFEQLTLWTRWLEQEFLPSFMADYDAAPETPSVAQPAEELARFAIEVDGKRHEIALPAAILKTGIADVPRPAQPLRSARGAVREEAVQEDSDVVSSPLQAIVVRVCVAPGEAVEEGQLVAVLESMKMEKYVNAPRAGVVAEVLTEAGQNVTAGQALVKLTEESE